MKRLLAVSLVALFVLSGSAQASHVQCGDVITGSVTLDSDVICPSQEGGPIALTIGADKITVDLNGHFVSSSGDPGGIDITTDGSRSKIVLRNSHPEAVGESVRLDMSKSVIENVTTSHLAVRGDGNLVSGSRVVSMLVSGRGNQIVGNVVGDRTVFDMPPTLGIFDFKNVVVRENHIVGALSPPIVLRDGRGATIADNVIELGADSPDPLEIIGSVSGVRLRRNVIQTRD